MRTPRFSFLYNEKLLRTSIIRLQMVGASLHANQHSSSSFLAPFCHFSKMTMAVVLPLDEVGEGDIILSYSLLWRHF
jgi:hypothetical protein